MIPDPPQALDDVAEALGRLLPELATTYAMADAGMILMLLKALSLELERGVANRLADLDELEVLFAAAEHAPGHQDRADALRQRPGALTLSAVRACHDGAMQALIDLHAWAEGADPELNLKIWDFLTRHTDRNSLDV